MTGLEDDNEFDGPWNALDDILVIAVAADPVTWLPQVIVGIPGDASADDDPDSPIQFASGYTPLAMTPDEAYQVGAYLIQAAAVVSSFYIELIDKTVEERKEIMELESQFLDSMPF